MYSIVLDTNVLVSGSIVQKGNSAFIIDSWRNEKIRIITSLDILNEFRNVILDSLKTHDFSRVIWKGNVVEPVQKLNIVKEDPEDNKFLEVAVECRADYIVSGDRDLLRLGKYNGIKIISPKEMADILKKENS